MSSSLLGAPAARPRPRGITAPSRFLAAPLPALARTVSVPMAVLTTPRVVPLKTVRSLVVRVCGVALGVVVDGEGAMAAVSSAGVAFRGGGLSDVEGSCWDASLAGLLWRDILRGSPRHLPHNVVSCRGHQPLRGVNVTPQPVRSL